MRWPLAIRKVFAEIWKEKTSRAIIKAPRGGGKSKMLSALAFSIWFFKDRSGIDMGGSLEQAKVVYNYFLNYCYVEESMMKYLKKEPTINHTETNEGNYFKCVAASPKQVRGPHPDFLFADEACETKDELIKDALPMVNTSQNALVVMTSTFHKIFGIFQETWDRADELGYKRFSWDIFDVVKTFDRKIFDDPRLNEEIPDLKELKKLSGGKSGDPEGWIPIKNVIQAWREKPTLDWFLVEYMGARPSAAGLVLRPEDVDVAVFDDKKETKYNYSKNVETIIGIDWGFSSMTSVVEMMPYKDGEIVMNDNKNYSQVRSEIIIKDVIKIVKEHGVRLIYADSAGKFENADLKKALLDEKLNCAVIEVVFSQDKEWMIGNLRAYFERKKIKIPQRLATAKWQFKRYRYQEGSDKPMKKDDHIPDATMCALKHWPLMRVNYQIEDVAAKSGVKTTSGILDEKF